MSIRYAHIAQDPITKKYEVLNDIYGLVEDGFDTENAARQWAINDGYRIARNTPSPYVEHYESIEAYNNRYI